jgi:hypothetical protein
MESTADYELARGGHKGADCDAEMSQDIEQMDRGCRVSLWEAPSRDSE